MPINSRGDDTFHQTLITYSRAGERAMEERPLPVCAPLVPRPSPVTVIDNNASLTSTGALILLKHNLRSWNKIQPPNLRVYAYARAPVCVCGAVPRTGAVQGNGRTFRQARQVRRGIFLSFFHSWNHANLRSYIYFLSKSKESREIIRSILEFSRNYKIQGFESVTLFTRNFSWKGGRLAENIYIQISGWIHASVNIVCAHFAAQTAT